MDAIRLLEEYEATHVAVVNISELELLPTVPAEDELDELCSPRWAEERLDFLATS